MSGGKPAIHGLVYGLPIAAGFWVAIILIAAWVWP